MPISISGDGSIGSLSATEIGYLDGVTSAVQTQINGKLTTPGVWTTYTPTITAGSGTPTTLTASGSYVQFGKIVHLRIQITITNLGTASGAIIFTLPVNHVFASPLAVGIANNNQNAVAGTLIAVDATRFGIWKYDGTTMWANNPIMASLTYEAA